MRRFSDIQPYLYSAVLKGSSYYVTITKKGDLSISLKLELPEAHTMGAEEYDKLHTDFNRIISELPSGMVMHKQDFFFHKKHNGTNLSRENILYTEYEKHFRERTFLDSESYIHLILVSDSFMTRKINTSIFSMKGENIKLIDNKETDKYFIAVDKFIQQIKKLGIGITPVGKEESISLKYKYFCFASQPKSIPEITFENDLTIGDKVIDIYSISSTKDLPSQVSTSSRVEKYSTERSSYMATYLYPLTFMLQCDHIVNTIISRVDEASLAKLVRDTNTQKVKLYRRFGNYNIKVYEDNEQYLLDCEDDRLNPCRMHFNVMVASDRNNSKERSKNIVEVEDAFATLDIRPVRNAIRTGNLFWSSAPGNAADMPQDLMPPTFVQVATCFINWESNYRNAIDGILLNDRTTQVPVIVDLWNKPMSEKIIANRNALVLGFSGEGKSVFLNHIFSQYLEQDYTLIVMDIGDSYKKLCELNGGLYFKYDSSQPLFNPFVATNGVNNEFIESLVDLLFVAWRKENPEQKTVTVVTDGVAAYYQYLKEAPKEYPCFDSYFKWYEKHRKKEDSKYKDSSFDAEDYCLVMSNFCTGGVYGNVFNGESTINLSQYSFIVFELDNIKDHPVLFPIVANVITHTVNNTIFEQVGKKKAIWVDEAWKVLEKPGMASFLKYLYKTIRKKEGQVGIALQDITDLPDSKEGNIGSTILNNSAIKIFLPHIKNINSVPIVSSRCSLTETSTSQLYSIRSDFKTDNPYTEFMIVLGNVSKPYRLELPKYSYYVYTSDQKENKEIYELQEQCNGNLNAAILRMIERHTKSL